MDNNRGHLRSAARGRGWAIIAAGIAGVGGLLTGLPHQEAVAQTGKKPAAHAAVSVGTARIVDAFGTVERRVGEGSIAYKPVNTGDTLPTDTLLRTGENAAALLQLPGNHLLRVGAKTTVVLRELGRDNRYRFEVLEGQVWSMVRKANHPAKYEVETPSAVAGVTGTIFGVSIDAQTAETLVSTDEGAVTVQPNSKDGTKTPSVAVTGGFALRVSRRAGGAMVALIPQKQTGEQRQMWQTLHHEGVLVRSQETGEGRLHLSRQMASHFTPLRASHPTSPRPARRPRRTTPLHPAHRPPADLTPPSVP